MIYIYNAGEFFGYSAILSDYSYGDTTQVIESSVIAFYPKRRFFAYS
ncbi:hypothetical protein [Chryseobacterium indoltheticum]